MHAMNNEYRVIAEKSSHNSLAEDNSVLVTSTFCGNPSLPAIDSSLIKNLQFIQHDSFFDLHNSNSYGQNYTSCSIIDLKTNLLKESTNTREQSESFSNTSSSRISLQMNSNTKGDNTNTDSNTMPMRGDNLKKILPTSKKTDKRKSPDLPYISPYPADISNVCRKNLIPVVVLHKLHVGGKYNQESNTEIAVENNEIRKPSYEFNCNQMKAKLRSSLRLNCDTSRKCEELSLSIDLSAIQDNEAARNINGRGHSTPLCTTVKATNKINAESTGSAHLTSLCHVAQITEKDKAIPQIQNEEELAAQKKSLTQQHKKNKTLNLNHSESTISRNLKKNCFKCKSYEKDSFDMKVSTGTVISKRPSELLGETLLSNNKKNIKISSENLNKPPSKARRRLIFEKYSRISRNGKKSMLENNECSSSTMKLRNSRHLDSSVGLVTSESLKKNNLFKALFNNSACVATDISRVKHKSSGQYVAADKEKESEHSYICNRKILNVEKHIDTIKSPKSTKTTKLKGSSLKTHVLEKIATVREGNIKETVEPEEFISKFNEKFKKYFSASAKKKLESLPKMAKPAKWIKKPLYKFLESKLNAKYSLEKRYLSERLVLLLHNAVSNTLMGHPEISLQILKQKLSEYDICNTQLEYYSFLNRFTPLEFIKKVVPLGRAYGNHDFKHENIGIRDPLQ